MLRRLRLLAAIVLAPLPGFGPCGPARADMAVSAVVSPYVNGSDEERHRSAQYLFGMVSGVLGLDEVASETTGRRMFCLVDGRALRADDYFEILTDYVRAHPAARSQDAGPVLARALVARFPCPR